MVTRLSGELFDSTNVMRITLKLVGIMEVIPCYVLRCPVSIMAHKYGMKLVANAEGSLSS